MEHTKVTDFQESSISYKPNERFDIYKVMHKYIRSEINDVTEQCGSIDFVDADERLAFKIKFEHLFNLLSSHAENEDVYIGPLLEEIKSQQLTMLKTAHEKLDAFFLSLKKDLESLFNKNQLSENELNVFYLKFVQFQSFYFNHLDDEETKITPELDNMFNDDRLRRANTEMLKNMPLDRMIDVTRGMLPKINHQERFSIYSEMQKSMPTEPFKQMCKLAQGCLSEKQFRKLFYALNLDASFLEQQWVVRQ